MSRTSAGPVDLRATPHARLRPLPFHGVTLRSGFWRTRQRINSEASLPHGYRMLRDAGNLELLEAAANRTGRSLDLSVLPPFMDSDVYKWLEAAAYATASGPSRGLMRAIRTATGLIVRAQMPDGYINSCYQVGQPEGRWKDLAYSHELYTAGHLFQAAVATNRVLHDPTLLEVATRFADHIDRRFGPGKIAGTDGHAEVETALVELYRETGERRYLSLARFFLDQRGHGLLGDNIGRWYWGGRSYFQDRVPVRQASEFEGHTTRALYLATGMVNSYLEDGDRSLLAAAMRQWRDLIRSKLYITGGIGSQFEIEGFGEGFELPPDHSYCESCAAVASVQFNWRLLLATGDARFAELMERTLYNGMLCGVSADGRSFFYSNTLLSRGSERRAPWFRVACCPPNLMRLIASFPHYIATWDSGGVQIHQYASLDLHHMTAHGPIHLSMTTSYPWEGDIRLSIDDTTDQPWTLSLRVPEWCDSASISVGDRAATIARGGMYVRLRRRWRQGDRVVLRLAMGARFTEASPLVDAVQGRVAVERGPLVYCFEQRDQPARADLALTRVDESASVAELRRDGPISDAVWLQVDGWAPPPPDRSLYRPVARDAEASTSVRLWALPYFMWANRGKGPMRVWMPRAQRSTRTRVRPSPGTGPEGRR